MNSEPKSNARAAVSQLKSQIFSEQNEVKNLEREKSKLGTLVRRYEPSVRRHKANKVDCQAQIRKCEIVQSEIGMLKQRLDSISTNALEVLTELQTAKMVLDEYSAAIYGQSVKAEAASSFTDRTHGKSFRNKREFQEQQRALIKITESLNVMHRKIPRLLEMNTKFLDIKPWNSTCTI